MPEEIKITGTLDTGQIENGVQRIIESIKKVEEAVRDSMEVPPGAASDAGERAGRDFSRGFLEKMLLRDAIYGVLSGIRETIKDAEKEMGTLTGVNIDIAPWREWAQTLVDGLRNIKSINDAARDHAVTEINKLKSGQKQKEFVDRLKERPEEFKESTRDIEKNITRLEREQTQNKIGQIQDHYAGGDAALHADENFKIKSEANAEELKQQRELLAIAKERDKIENEAMHKRNEASLRDKKREDERAAKMQKELDTSIEQSQKHYRQWEKQEEAKAKKKRHLDLDREGESAGEAKRVAEGDLRSAESNLSHQKAASLVRINGGVYGKNDSTGSLVQHAAQQVNILRNIESELKSIKAQKQELTLL